MKVMSFKAGGATSFGVVVGDGVVDAAKRTGLPSLRAVLEAGRLGELQALSSEKPDHALGEVEFLPVLPDPGHIWCVGLNYKLHVAETGRDTPTHPWVFTRSPRSQVGHGQAMIRPAESVRYDFEGELAVIIGKAGRRISRDAALSHVAGYACYNEGSVRDWQMHSNQYTPGKNWEKSGAFGPWMVTSDDIPDPTALTLQTRLNGQVMQDTPVSDLLFDIPHLIGYLSTFTTLQPGDVIVTGTPGGVGNARKPPVYMKGGDIIEVEISQIGVLKNPIQDEA
jgi:2-keto-4-pentenoate hydratase/2-oxohepta-3-ene-1,7-dioic acid hydratase in catechol pathway